MALILSIETSTTVCSVALHDKDKLIKLQELNFDKSHSKHLIPLIQELFLESGRGLNELNAVALSKGPGSYTGLRIGSSTAKGLCYALDIPLIAVSTLEAMAIQIASKTGDRSDLFCPMIDARRMEVFTGIYDFRGVNVLPVQPIIIENDAFADFFNTNVKLHLFGNGADKCKGIVNDDAIFIDDINPSAESIGQLAFKKFLIKEFENAAYFEPFYLKEFYTTAKRMN